MSHDAACYDPTACTQACGQNGFDQTARGQTAYDRTQASTQASTQAPKSKPEDAEPTSHNSVTAASLITYTMVIVITLVAVIALLVLFIAGTGFGFGTDRRVPKDKHIFPPAVPDARLPSHAFVASMTATDTTMAPTASTLSPRKAMDKQPLVCTMGSKTSSERMFPPDGLCEYIFFDSVEKDNRNLLAFPYRWNKILRIFIASYFRYSSTAFGIGFAYERASSLLKQLTRSGYSLLEPFWRERIFHFGILDTATRNARQMDVGLALNVLKVLDKLAETQRRQGKPSFIFFAGVGFNQSWTNFYSERFTNVYKPDLFIVQGHYFYGDNTFLDCRVMPPTALSRPAGFNDIYQHDLTMAADSLKLLSLTGLSLIWALSVTMKGRWTMTPPGEQRDFLSVCVHNTSAPSFGRYSEVCRNRRFLQRSYNATQDAILAVYDKESVLFAYDDEVSLCRKLCFMKAQHSALRFGIAVYDLEYEDFSNTCVGFNKYGAFSRLRAIRHILNYFRTTFKSGQDVTGCQELIK